MFIYRETQSSCRVRTRAHFPMRRPLRFTPHFGRRPNRRGVSDVVGTILLLGLAIALFATFYTFVSTFPPPPPQSSAQFSASISDVNVTGKGLVITYIHIAYLAGPTLYNGSNTRIYCSSNNQPAIFNRIYTVTNGLHSAVWSIGETWSVNITSFGLQLPDNITLSIVVNGQLYYRDTVPGDTLHVPPQFVNVFTNPAQPTLGSGFLIVMQIQDPFMVPTSSLKVALFGIPGLSGYPTQNATFSPQNGTWQVWVPGLASSIGTFFVYLNATDSQGLHNVVAEPIEIYPAPSSTLPGQANAVVVTLSLSGVAVDDARANLTVHVINNAGTGGNYVGLLYVNGMLANRSAGFVGASSLASFFPTWIPSTGPADLFERVSISGTGQGNATLNTTVLPSIILVESNTQYPAGQPKAYGPADEAGWLAAALTAAGFVYTVQTVSCKSGIGLATSYESYDVAIFDFGSSSTSPCVNVLNLRISGTNSYDSVQIGNLIRANTTSVWVVGSNAFGLVAGSAKCPAAAGFMHLFGLNSATNCGAKVTLTASATYAAAPAKGLLGLGVPGAGYTINSTVAKNATFQATDLNLVVGGGATATTFLTSGANTLGTVYNYAPAHGIRDALLTIDPSMLVQALPSPMGVAWGSGAGAAEVAYNVVNYLGGISTNASSSPNRLDINFGVSEVVLKGFTHTAPSLIAGVVQSNGVTGGFVTVALYVNGTPALYGGVVVAETFYLAPGAVQIVEFAWQAPGGGSYAISVKVFSPLEVGPANAQLGTGFLSPRTVFT
jgi:hypothetical protein